MRFLVHYSQSQKYMGSRYLRAPSINLGGVLLEEVESFKYLGFSFTATGQAKDEISESPVPLPA